MTSDYQYAPENPNCNHLRSVEWRKTGTWPDKDIVAKTLTEISKYKDYAARLVSELEIGFDPYPMNIRKMGSLNTILYGPPGTGKTFHTISKALEIMGVDTKTMGRKQQKEEFQRLQDAGRIAFVTFHQSMSYEDFVEGIKPVTDGNGRVTYEIQAGVFRRICIEAAFEFVKETQSSLAQHVLDFSAAFDILTSRIEEQLLLNQTPRFQSRTGSSIIVVSISDRGNLLVKHENGGKRTYIVSKERLAKLDKAIPDLGKVENMMTEFRNAIGGSNDTAFYAVLKEIRTIQANEVTGQSLVRSFTREEKQQAVNALQSREYQVASPLPHLLIIDEINRGNVSQIFGELITLIEEDKRAGNDEALTVTLPYSKEPFSVPKNLYIIGTMNTADRSVEALDTALRRRFEFVEMAPKPEKLRVNPEDYESEWLIVNDFRLCDILHTLNLRIEKLLDRDHCIGHAYFIGVDNLEKLKSAFQHKIIPLLQEYFYGDYAKIGLVLGKGFVTLASSERDNADDLFADFQAHHRNDLARREVWHLRDVGKMDADAFLEALKAMKIKTFPGAANFAKIDSPAQSQPTEA